jgi:hypothetical protein
VARTTEPKAEEGSVERKRKDALEKFFGLSEKALKHIAWSLEAKVICAMCSVDAKTGAHVPGKAKDDDGKCAFCHATGYVPDKEQRNWATGQVADRIAPKPKSVEMAIEQSTPLGELEKEVANQTDDELKKLAAGGGVIFLSA